MTRLTAGCKVNPGAARDRRAGLTAIMTWTPCFTLCRPPATIWRSAKPADRALPSAVTSLAWTRERNTLTKAYAAFVKAAGSAPGITVELRKGIPLGSGLGGGSSDAASLLLWLNQRAAQPLDDACLARAALAVGADTPFFLYNQPCRVQGIGEVLTPMDYDFSGLNLVLVCPGIHVDTAWAFAAMTFFSPEKGRQQGKTT